MAKKRTAQEQSIDPAAQAMLIRAEELGISTAFSRADEMVPCNIGGAGMCCKLCGMGPCRLTKDGQTGICGATIDTIQARNLIRAIAAGVAAHSDHGRDMAFILKAVANHEPKAMYPRCRQAASWPAKRASRSKTRPRNHCKRSGRSVSSAQFGQQRGRSLPITRATEKARSCGRAGRNPARDRPRGGRSLHRTHIGDDQDPEHICTTRSAHPWPMAGAAA
jgi:anaerobic carbon-monoxide dehydrogenase catalytic subunit